MATNRENRSKLVKMRVCNLGCIGPKGIEISLDDIVCLVGPNNTGKTTVLRAYEAAVGNQQLSEHEFNLGANGAPVVVELWVHIPEGAENIDKKWKEKVDGLLLVRSKWEWPTPKTTPLRTTWDPEAGDYAKDGKAAGLDEVFSSRLPKPFRIGSLEDPEEEHKRLLALVLEPIKNQLLDLMKDDTSPIRAKVQALQEEAEKPVAQFRKDIEKVESRVNRSYRRVFSSAEIKLNVSLGDIGFDPAKALAHASRIDIMEPHGTTGWDCQGTGSQRALFWSMLEVRSELNRIADARKQKEKADKDLEKKLAKLRSDLPAKKTQATIDKYKTQIAELESTLANTEPNETETTAETFLPGYMLLIDEPETALHPSAVRAAKRHLYSLASASGWQVMLSTHHPAFVDPLEDHTTIVRLHRPEAKAPPNIYRADEVQFSDHERENLKALFAFDLSVAEMFFGARIVIIEGDTEFGAFTLAMDADPDAFPIDTRPLLVRARGKWTIPILIRMLAHSRVDFAVLHDIDAPRSRSGAKRNSAFSANHRIVEAVKTTRDKGVRVTHRLSCPEFERQHGMVLPSKDKPFEAWRKVQADKSVMTSVRGVLDGLAQTTPHADPDPQDGEHFEVQIKAWAETNAKEDPAFKFDANDENKEATE